MLLAVEAVVVAVVPCRDGFVVGIVVVFAEMCLEVVLLVCGLPCEVAALGKVGCAVVNVCTVNGPPSYAGEAWIERRLFKWYA